MVDGAVVILKSIIRSRASRLQAGRNAGAGPEGGFGIASRESVVGRCDSITEFKFGGCNVWAGMVEAVSSRRVENVVAVLFQH